MSDGLRLEGDEDWPAPGWMAMLADELDMVEDPAGRMQDIVDALPENFTWRELITEVRWHHSMLKRLEAARRGPTYTLEEVLDHHREPSRHVPGLFT